MASIRVLPESLVNKIAAGEVVERPASVVKELIENSIDAGGDSISVEVKGAGRKLIRVADNGAGMDREDALMSLKSHATSKLADEGDLTGINTLGFRGEALASIASVSRLMLVTAPGGAATGVRVESAGGEVLSVRESPSEGTCVEVRDLFFNTPARRRFLKQDSTEMLHIVDALTRSALAHAEVGFTLTSGARETMVLPRASGLRERLMQVYGPEFFDGLIRVERKSQGIGLEAFVSAPENMRDTRAHQMVFVNRRPVRDPSLSHAVESAYGGVAQGGRHPIFFLFLDIDPAIVDVNVHPSKREVRFENKEAVYRFVRRSVAEAVGVAVQITGPAEPQTAGRYTEGAGLAPDFGTQPRTTGAPVVAEALTVGYSAEIPFFYIGETFVAFAEDGGITLLDHHAAHERVLFERLLGRMRLDSKRLLFPRPVRLSPREHMLVMGHKETLLEFGMEIEEFGPDTVAVRSIPEGMEEADIRGVLLDAAEEMGRGEAPGRPLREALAARIACHGSIRGPAVLTREALTALLKDLKNTREPDRCPHGRPTRLHYGIDYLRRLFQRR